MAFSATQGSFDAISAAGAQSNPQDLRHITAPQRAHIGLQIRVGRFDSGSRLHIQEIAAIERLRRFFLATSHQGRSVVDIAGQAIEKSEDSVLTKADFLQAVCDSESSDPAIAPLYRAGDPRVMQHVEAMATMLVMYLAQLETATSEPFEKTRDAPVLADAAMRGIVRKATAARVRIRAVGWVGSRPAL